MNLLENGALTLASACGGVAMGFGYRWASIPGAVAGLLLGTVGGLVIVGGTIAGVFWVGILLERLSKHVGLSPYFGRYWGHRRAPAWAELGYLMGNPPINEDGPATYFPITHRAHAAFREQLEQGESVPCQLLPSGKAVRRVRVEKTEWQIRIRDVAEDEAPARASSGFDDETMKSP